MISEQEYIEAARKLGCKPAAVKAVAEVESAGAGFLEDGTPKILFEPHIFWKELRKKGIDPASALIKFPNHHDVLYPVWKSNAYGAVSAQHDRLKKASLINRDAALMAASWGKFQILGTNWRLCNFGSLQDFINAMYHSEYKHLMAFVQYIKSSHLDDEIINEDWEGLAAGYNGPSYRKNKYHIKLADAFKKFSESL